MTVLPQVSTGCKMFVVLLLSAMLTCCQSSDDIIKVWFSTYGEADYARIPSEGTNKGEMNKFQCSRLCAEDTDCKAFQFKWISLLGGTCVVFDKYVLRKNMVFSSGTKYYEKRNCAEDFPIHATVLYRSDLSSSMFSELYVRTYRFTVVNKVITGVNRLAQRLISDVYPGYTDTVDAGFEMVGVSPSRTVLLKGTREFCYERISSATLTFRQCPDTDYLGSFFTHAGVDHVDSIAVYDIADNDLHVIVYDRVYHLRHSSSSGKFEIIDNYPVLQAGSSNPWYNAFNGITAMFRLTSRSYYLFEGSKYIRYDIVNKQITSSPLIVCNDY